MEKKSTVTSIWTPINHAFDRAKNINKEAQKIARKTVAEVRERSEAALTAAQKRLPEGTVQDVRKRLVAARKSFEKQADQITQVIEEARKQVRPLEEQLLRGVESVARSLNLAVERDVDALRRKVSTLEKRVNEIVRETEAA
jgi:polyhydroxyalkanoate synthesis regulator phasin